MKVTGLVFAVLFGTCVAVKITDFSVPRTVFEGSRARLDCRHDLEGAALRHLKWFINGEEFFRHYLDSGRPAFRYFNVPGVKVDRDNSDGGHVILNEVGADSGGIYKCAVEAESGGGRRGQPDSAFQRGNLTVVDARGNPIPVRGGAAAPGAGGTGLAVALLLGTLVSLMAVAK